MEAILTRAKFRASVEAKGKEKPQVSKEILQAVVDDFIPASYPLEIELQNLAAVLECTSQNMLPESYRSIDREAAVRRVKEIKRLI